MIDKHKKKACFFLLKESRKNNLICEIAEKYYNDNKSVCIFTASRDDACVLDSMLWSFKQTSFIPHDIIESADKSSSEIPVKIIYNEIDKIHTDVLIISRHMDKENILFIGKFHEIVDFAQLWDENLKLLSRQRYALLKNLGYAVETKEI